jgi:hypothetical protein
MGSLWDAHGLTLHTSSRLKDKAGSGEKASGAAASSWKVGQAETSL